MTTSFRAKLVLKIFNKYNWGDHVTDPIAFVMRARAYFRGTNEPLHLLEEHAPEA